MICQCTATGDCSTLGRYQGVQELLICQGKALTPEKCDVIRENWLKLRRCEHRGAQVDTRTQKVQKKDCGTCGQRGNVVPVFTCALHGLCTISPWQIGQKENICVACSDYKVVVRTTEVNNAIN
jgi:hypothetical protein